MAVRVSNVPTFIHPKLHVEQVTSRAHEEMARFQVTFGRTFANSRGRCTPPTLPFSKATALSTKVARGMRLTAGHHSNGLKVDLSVKSGGITINYADFAKGSMADIPVFRRSLVFHQKMRVITENDLALDDQNKPNFEKNIIFGYLMFMKVLWLD
uniref:AlNc14C426G11555 protein n=1 Tax=Albugo laibachii Nc14 TaxID=890382 RepID=F0WZF3_9STRA|nr:AlNc14C426G11555 [Albugo laibachii Nc14]|eukprot:CCA26873.1 AlNc14C426G11555 [Albugo laibachii Nc14]